MSDYRNDKIVMYITLNELTLNDIKIKSCKNKVYSIPEKEKITLFFPIGI